MEIHPWDMDQRWCPVLEIHEQILVPMVGQKDVKIGQLRTALRALTRPEIARLEHLRQMAVLKVPLRAA